MKKKNLDVGAIGGLIIVCVFAVAMFMTLAFGSLIYKDVSDVMEGQYTVRTAASYLSTRVRQGNARGMVSLGEFDGCEALIIREESATVADEAYLTYIYCWNGYLRELYCVEGSAMLASDGDEIIAADSVSFELDGTLLKAACSCDGRSAVQYINLAL